ncbi:MAG: Crp/Fnr family transcriptional regulator [Bacteroides sp.]|nr:Crp/Fnr family transcriptional regulator [Bacteroides sp.]MDE7441835.1 hypothetical protein [Muribaculaceae bacterium]
MCSLSQSEIENTKKILSEFESLYPVSPDLFDPLFEVGEVRDYTRQEIIMHPGQQLREVHIVLSGLIGSTYISGNKVVMNAMAIPCTVLLHGGSFFRKRAPMMQWEALVNTRTLCIPDSFIREYMQKSHEFALWMHGVAENFILYSEERAILLSGDAERRYLNLEKNLPRRIFRELPSRVVARYLGITEQSLSRIKRSLLKSESDD